MILVMLGLPILDVFSTPGHVIPPISFLLRRLVIVPGENDQKGGQSRHPKQFESSWGFIYDVD
jgi:hypothetical protein